MKITAPCLLAASLIVSCNLSKPITQYPGDMTLYKNAPVSWAPINDQLQKMPASIFFNEAADSLIKQEVNHQLVSRGYRVGGERAALFVNYCMLDEEKLASLDMTYKERYGRNGLYTSNYPDSSKEWLFMLRSKTLIIDLVDTKSNQLIWRGWSTNIENSTKGNQPKFIRETVEEIFKQFSPGVK